MYERLLEGRRKRQRESARDYFVCNEIAFVLLPNKEKAFFDRRYAETIGVWSWHLNAGYACNGGGSRPKMYLHHAVLYLAGLEVGKNLLPDGVITQVDHISGNRLDNRLRNLRVVTRSENMRNRASTSASGYRGVSWDKKKGKWVAYIVRNRRQKFLGHFDDKTEAALAYDRAAIAHGGVSRLNILEGEV